MAQATRPVSAPRRRWTYQDLVGLPDDGQRYEIIRGKLHVTPAPRPGHQDTVLEIAYRIRRYLEERSVGKVFVAPVDVRAGVADPVQPDLLFIAQENLGIVGEGWIGGAPDLVIEVESASTRNYDATTKRDAYEAIGVREYWRVDPESRSVTVLRREGETFGPEVVVRADGALTTPLLPGCELRVAQIFDS